MGKLKFEIEETEDIYFPASNFSINESVDENWRSLKNRRHTSNRLCLKPAVQAVHLTQPGNGSRRFLSQSFGDWIGYKTHFACTVWHYALF